MVEPPGQLLGGPCQRSTWQRYMEVHDNRSTRNFLEGPRAYKMGREPVILSPQVKPPSDVCTILPWSTAADDGLVPQKLRGK